MTGVNKTLYIPLYGKALVSRKGILLDDKKAEEIWEKEGFPLKGKSKSKWLAYYMAMRAKVFDRWLQEKMQTGKDFVVLHLGCGMDARIERVQNGGLWYDVDFQDVIEERKKYFEETASYRMLPANLKETDWLNALPPVPNAVVVMEGVSMYLTNEELRALLKNLTDRFAKVNLLLDCYTPFAVKMTKIKNPINEVGVRNVTV